MRRFVKPILVVSRCLGFDCCRYDSQMVESPFMAALRPWAHLLTVCPEMEIGLGVPREKIRIVGKNTDKMKLFQPATGRDLTRQMQRFARGFVKQLDVVDGFLLKSKSPSCGLGTCKLFESEEKEAKIIGRVSGFFAAEVERVFGAYPMTDEHRLEDDRRREQWLTAVFTLAAFRKAAGYDSVNSLRKFHEYHHTLLMVHGKRRTVELGKMLEQDSVKNVTKLTKDYRQGLLGILARKPRRQLFVKAFEPAVENYRRYLTKQNLRRYDSIAEEYSVGTTSLAELRALIQVWGVRYDKNFIREHALYRPYPGELAKA